MTLYYTIRGQVRITVLSYIDEIITTFNKADPKGKGTKSGVNPNNIFFVNEQFNKLDQDKVVKFHNIVANTLYATMRSRPDTCIAIAFLTTRARYTDEEN